MAKREISEEQPKRRSRGWIVLLILLLILAGGAGYLYYTVCRAPLDLDDPQKMAAAAPMSAEERFRFFPADSTVQIKVDATDLWYLILDQAGPDFLDAINEKLSSYNLTLSGCAISMDEEGLRLDLEVFFRDFRLVVKVPCTLEVREGQFSLTPSGVKMGEISLPVGNALSSVKLEYDLSLPVISQVTQVSFVQDGILLTGPMEQDVRTLVPMNEKLQQTALFSDSMQPLADCLLNPDGFAAILAHLEQDPGSIEALYRDVFTLAAPKDTKEYLNSRHGLTQRFLPGVDFSATEKEQSALMDMLTSRNLILEQFFTGLVCDYNDKAFRLADGKFFLKGKIFQAAEYSGGKYNSIFEVLDPESFFLVLVDAEDGFIRKTSSFYRMADEDLEFTQSVDYNKTYILGCVLRSVDGEPFLMYESEIRYEGSYARSISLIPLTEEEAGALQVEGKFGVWTG